MIVINPQSKQQYIADNIVTCFLGGGITNCRDWQKEDIEELYNLEKQFDLTDLVILNPRRQHFDINKIKAEDQIKEWAQLGIHADAIVVDPPRKGCEGDFLTTVVEMNIPKIVYVSCDVSTLARDMKYLVENGYKPGPVQPVDMFPQTVHVENVVCLEKKQTRKTEIIK